MTPTGHGDDEDHHRHDQRQPVGVGDAGEEVAADGIGAEQVLPAGRRRHGGEIADRADVVGIGRDEIGEDGDEDDRRDDDEPDHGERVGAEDVPGPAAPRPRRLCGCGVGDAHARLSAKRMRGLMNETRRSTMMFTIRNAAAMISTVPTIASRSFRMITSTP